MGVKKIGALTIVFAGLTLFFQNCSNYNSARQLTNIESHSPEQLPEPKNPNLVNISILDSSTIKGHQATAIVQIDKLYKDDIVLNWQTLSGSALEGVHFVGTAGTLSIPAGTSESTITIELIKSELGDIDFIVELSGVNTGVLAKSMATITIPAQALNFTLKEQWLAKKPTVVDAPSARWGTAHTWTGSEMFVWGGWSADNANIFGDGALYNPTTDSWRAITGNGGLNSRLGARAVWTGDRVLVWGGLANNAATNTGFYYDPVTNTWEVMEQLNTIAPRSFHAMTWLDNKLFVWGGFAPGVFQLGDGAIYDPTTRLWTTINGNGALPPSQWVRAIWTGQKVMIFGSCTPYSNTLVAYDPTTDLWEELDNTNAPSARCGNALVWTGDEVIAYGGGDGNGPGSVGPSNNGGIYDPQINQWRPLPAQATSPRPLVESAGVWTGTQMIFWGGFGNYSNRVGLNDGGFFE